MGAKRDRAAIPALVLGILALPFGLFAPLAIWTGVRSLARIRGSRGELGGAAMATGGLVAGMIGLATLVVGTVYWIVAS